MSFTLGAVTLPQPKTLTRRLIEKSVEHLLMFGKTTKKIENRKEQFVLQYMYLTATQISEIFSQFELDAVMSFTVSETNLSIGPTDVLIDITGLEYPPTAELYRENLTLTLTEVI